MRICLVNPPLSLQAPWLFLPLQLMVLSASLKRNQIEVAALDFNCLLEQEGNEKYLNDNFFQWSAKLLLNTGCHVFGFSSMCANFPIALIMARYLKKLDPNSLVIFGGCQPSLTYRETMEKYNEIDCIVIGEGDVILPQLVQSKFCFEELSQIPGIIFRFNNIIQETTPAQLIPNLDDLPFVDTTLFNIDEYVDICSRKRYNKLLFDIEAGRGCPGSCTYCSTSIMWQRKFRIKSPRRIFAEMEYVYQKTGYKYFSLVHDFFTFSKKNLVGFCDFFKQNNIYEFKWAIDSRIDYVSEILLAQMVEAGCNGIFIGVETASKRIQKSIRKNLDLSKWREVLRSFPSLARNICASFIIGFPEETKEEVNQTLLLMLQFRLNGTRVSLGKLCPLSGTDILDKYKDRLFRSPHNSFCESPLPNSSLIEEEIGKHPYLFSSYYSIPNNFMEDYYLSCLQYFFLTVIREFPRAIAALVQTTMLPTEIFDIWAKWKDEFHPNEPFDVNFIKDTFLSFVRYAESQRQTTRHGANR